MNSKPCEWCDKDTTIVCSQCREIHLCSKACMKLIWKEHKRTCERVEQAGSAVDALMEDLRELSVETEGQTRWWLKLQEQQKLIAEYMDVVSLCRMDAAMTGRAERREWQRALKNLGSVALNKWPHYSSANKFKGLKWCQLRRIMLQGFQLERVVYKGASVPRENHFIALCMLGNSNIATLMAKTGSIPGGVESKDRVGHTPLITASSFWLKEVVAALIEAGVDSNVQGKELSLIHISEPTRRVVSRMPSSA